MGMFDSFFLKTKCPYCGEVAVREFQTKMFRCCMDEWEEGSLFDVSGVKIVEGVVEGVYGGCTSDECTAWQVERDGHKSGFGRCFYCDVLIEDGLVKEAINVRVQDAEE